MSDIETTLREALADRYVIDRLIGEGGMATVYLARDVRHNRRDWEKRHVFLPAQKQRETQMDRRRDQQGEREVLRELPTRHAERPWGQQPGEARGQAVVQPDGESVRCAVLCEAHAADHNHGRKR